LNINFDNGYIPFTIFNPNGGIVALLGTLTHGQALFNSGYQITGESYYKNWPAAWFNAANLLYLNSIGIATGVASSSNFYADQLIGWQCDLLGLGNKNLTATVLAMGNYSAGKIERLTTMKNLNWDTFYFLLWEVLNNNNRNSTLQSQLLSKSLGQLNSAPCEGPYCYKPDTRIPHYLIGKKINLYNTYDTNGVYSGGGWATSYRWYEGEDDQDHGKTIWIGNFNGCDYMLLYNLYQIMTANTTAPFYVSYINRNLVGTVNSPNDFVGYSTVSSTQTIEPTAPTVIYEAGDSIDLKQGFHAVNGSNFHAFIGNVGCSGTVYTNYYDSLISNPKQQQVYSCTVNDDTTLDNTISLPCPNDTIHLTGKICDTCISYHWDFGNGDTSNLQYPSVYYSTPGNYTITAIFVDTTGEADTAIFNVVAPNCTIYGYLFENLSCGGAPICGDSLCMADSSGVILTSVSPAYTQINGYFAFNSTQINLLDTNKKYTIISKNGISLIQPPGAQKISQWEKQSAVNLYYSTTVVQQWEKRYNGTADSTDYATALDLQGNIYVTGATDSLLPGSNMLTIKYAPSGAQLWAETYSGNRQLNHANVARAIIADDTGNVYITGESDLEDVSVLTTLRYNTNGLLQWVQPYQPYIYTTPASTKCVLLDHAGNIVVGATSIYPPTGSNIFTIVKYTTTTGDSLWSQHYSGPASVSANTITAIAVDTNNNIYATGYSLNNSGYYTMATVKFNSSGTQLWVKRDSVSNNNNYAYSNTVDNNGNIIVTGYSQTANGSNDEIIVISYAPSGSINWTKTYSTDTKDYAYKVLCDNANNVYVCGYDSTSAGTGLLALKYDSNGNLLWNKYSLSTNKFVFKSAALDVAGDIYITGTTTNSNGYKDITTQKIDGSDSIKWTMTYNGPTNYSRNNIPGQIMVSPNGNVYVCGASDSTGTGYDFTTIKYSQCLSTAPLLKVRTTTTGVPATALDTVKESYYIQVIPNPNNGNMHVVYKNPENTIGSFNVYNIMGKQVLSYPLNTGTNTLIISRTDLDPGIYLYRAIAGSKLIGKDKIVIIK
jgi:hypothetical protein